MKQANLFDLFSGKSKKKETLSASQSSNVASAETASIGPTEMLVEETKSEPVLIESNGTKIKEEINIITKESKKRKSDSSTIQQSPSSTVDKDDLAASVKQIKLNSSDSDLNQTPVKVDLTQYPPKDLSKLRKLTDLEYNAYHDAPFWPGENVPFSFLSACFEEVSVIKGENSKDKITEIIGNMFRSILLLTPTQLPLAYYFCTLKVAPDYEEQSELGIGNEILVKAVAKSSGRSDKYIRDAANQTGDLGKVAATSKATQSTMEKFMKKNEKKTTISLKHVMEGFRRMARLRGNNSNLEREAILVKLLFDAKDNEPKYIVRFVQKNLKIGAAEATMQAALVRAFLVSNYVDETKVNARNKNWSNVIPDYVGKLQKYEEAVKRAICELPNYDKLIESLTKIGKDIEKLQELCKISPGIPVKPMLAKPTKGINIILQRFENMKFTCEYKYDGLRGQIHYDNGKCQIFSRNLENMTETYPDIVEFVLSSTKPEVSNFIIDSEIVAINTTTQRILPFQTLSTRSRKNVDKNAIEIQVCLYVFDILYFNGESLLKTPFVDRRKCLTTHFKEVENKLKFAEYLDTDSFDEIQEFLQQSVKVGCEGLMVKTLDTNSTYEPSRRSFKWLKLKKDYLDDGLGDSFDLVPIGAIYGTGKRGGLYGSYIMATYNPDMERYETFCKLATGFSDEDLANFHKFFQDHLIKEPLSEYKIKIDGIDVWFEPCVVWEVRGADIQISPVHTAAIGRVDNNRGLGLRFPRLIKVRDDKTPIEATEPSLIVDAYHSQAAIMNTKENRFDDDEDLY